MNETSDCQLNASKRQMVFVLAAAFFVFVACCYVRARRSSVVLSPVPIVTRLDGSMFQVEWTRAPLNTSATPIDAQEKTRAVAEVCKAMSKYPSELLESNLEKVYLVGELRFDGITAGGTNSYDRIYQTVRSRSEGFTDLYLRMAFHHELSSIFLRNYGTSQLQNQWESVNPTGFEYLGSGTLAVAKGYDSEEYDPVLAADGFFCLYSKSSFEEDFNTVAAALLVGDPKIWDAAEQFPAMMKKVELMLDFYENLDPRFTKNYFKSFR